MKRIDNIKAIVLDLDGTLLSSNLRILDDTQKILKQLIKNGIRIIIATGRTPQTAIPMTKQLNIKAPMVLANGALIYDPITNQVIHSNSIKKNTVYSLLKLSKEINKSLNIYTPHCIYLEEERIIPYMKISGDDRNNLISQNQFNLENELVLKCEFFGTNDGKNDKLKKRVLRKSQEINDDLYITSAHTDFLEILNKNVNKLHGIKYVLNKFDISENQVLLFGDSHNDVEMLSNFPYSIAMGNAETSAKDASKYYTKSNDNNGISFFIKNYTNLV